MSSIYKNTAASSVIGLIVAMIRNDNQTEGVVTVLNGAFNALDLIIHGTSNKTIFNSDNVFFSPKQEWFDNCYIQRHETNNIDVTAKAAAVVLAGLKFAPIVGEYIKSHDIVFLALPSAIALGAETIADIAGWNYTSEEAWITDTYGNYTYYNDLDSLSQTN